MRRPLECEDRFCPLGGENSRLAALPKPGSFFVTLVKRPALIMREFGLGQAARESLAKETTRGRLPP